MGDVQGWNVTDASNTDLFPENMPFSGVNDGGRAVQGVVARWFQDTNGSVVSSGSSNSYAITSNRTIGSLANNTIMAWSANHTNTGAATLNLNGLGAKSIKRFNGSELGAGDIISGQPVVAIYKSSPDQWFMMTAPAALITSSFADFSENGSPGDPAADVGRLYAKDVSGTTFLAYRDSAGLERVLSHAGELIAIIEDQKAQNTAGQSLTANTDNVRELNTLVYNRNTLVSLSSNRFTLPAGTWEIEWESPSLHALDAVVREQSFLYNQSDSTEVKRGTSNSSDNEDTAYYQRSKGKAVVTIAGSKAFEIRHHVASFTISGGVVANLGTEVYTRVTVRRA